MPHEVDDSGSQSDWEALASHYHEELLATQVVLDRLFEMRGWSEEAIRALKLGFDGKLITFPVQDANGSFVGLRRYQPSQDLRVWDGQPVMTTEPGSKLDLFPPPEMVDEGDELLFLLEGEPDVVSAHTLGLAAVGLPGLDTWRRSWRTRFRGRRVCIVFDCEDLSRTRAQRVADDLKGIAADLRVFDLAPRTGDGFDLSDMIDFLTSLFGALTREKLLATAEETPQVTKKDHGLEAIPASAVESKKVRWLWKERIPLGGLTLLAGDPGLGKSILTCDLAARLSRGELGEEAGVTLLASAEDSQEATLRPRLEAAGADLDRVFFLERREFGGSLSLPRDIARLRGLVRKHGARLIVIDPLMAHLPASVNSWQDQSVRGALAPLHALADLTGAAVVVVAHLNKGQERDPLRRIGGSIGVPAAARSALLLARDPDDPEGEQGSRRVLAHVKSNLGPLAPSLHYEVETVTLPGDGDGETARLRLLGGSSYSGADLLASSIGGESTSLEEAKEFLKAELADGPKAATQLIATAADLGIADRTLKRAKAQLGIESTKTAFNGRWSWALKGS